MHLIGHRKTRTEQLLDQATELVERAAPHVEAVRAKLADEVLPLAQERAHEAATAARETARDTALPRAREAYEIARLKAEEHLPHRKKETHRLRNTAVVVGLAGLAAWAVRSFFPQERKLPYVPPAPSDAPSSTLRPPPQRQAGTVGDPLPGYDSARDSGGADPAEALSDQQAGPHPVTTPDAPAEAELFDQPRRDQREP